MSKEKVKSILHLIGGIFSLIVAFGLTFAFGFYSGKLAILDYYNSSPREVQENNSGGEYTKVLPMDSALQDSSVYMQDLFDYNYFRMSYADENGSIYTGIFGSNNSFVVSTPNAGNVFYDSYEVSGYKTGGATTPEGATMRMDREFSYALSGYSELGFDCYRLYSYFSPPVAVLDSSNGLFPDFSLTFDYGDLVYPIFYDSYIYPRLRFDTGSKTGVDNYDDLNIEIAITGHYYNDDGYVRTLSDVVALTLDPGVYFNPFSLLNTHVFGFYGNSDYGDNCGKYIYISDCQLQIRLIDVYRVKNVHYTTIIADPSYCYSANTLILLQEHFPGLTEGYIDFTPEILDFDFVAWLGKSVGSFMEFKIFPGFSIAGLLTVCLSIPILMYILKLLGGK